MFRIDIMDKGKYVEHRLFSTKNDALFFVKTYNDKAKRTGSTKVAMHNW